MKKQLLIMAALCTIAFTSNAQTEKGKNLLGGSIKFLSTNLSQGTQSQTVKDYGISPSYGHFFASNLAIGIKVYTNISKNSVNYDVTNSTNGIITYSTATNNTKQTQYSFGPFIRYYLGITETFKFFAQFDASIGFGKNHQDINGVNNPIDNKLTNYSTSLSPNLAFFPTKKWAVELGFDLLSYNRIDYNGTTLSPKITIDNFNFGFNSFAPRVGVNYHF